MPYIPCADREDYTESLDEILSTFERSGVSFINEADLGGHLNFCISYLLTRLFEERTQYIRINTLIGAIEGAKQEFHRFHVIPYEETKRQLNGDV